MYYSINTKVALFIVFFCFWVATHLCLFAWMDKDIGIYELTDTVICDFQSFNQIFQRPFMVPKLPWPTSHLGLSACSSFLFSDQLQAVTTFPSFHAFHKVYFRTKTNLFQFCGQGNWVLGPKSRSRIKTILLINLLWKL